MSQYSRAFTLYGASLLRGHLPALPCQPCGLHGDGRQVFVRSLFAVRRCQEAIAGPGPGSNAHVPESLEPARRRE